MKVHILDDWHDTLRHLPSFAALAGHEVTVWTDSCLDPAVLATRLHQAEVLVLFRERTPITEALLSRLPNLRLIAMRGVHPHVDVEACTRHGVLFCSDTRAGAPSIATAELTLALMLACSRDLLAQNARLKAGLWQGPPGRTLAGRQMGIWGHGRIGRQVALYARALGMPVVWWGSPEGRARAEAAGETLAPSREAFFAESDVVSIHLRLTPATRGLITAQDLALMRPDAIFLNTSRAALVAPGALLAALNAGRPGRAGIDVFDTEPLTDPADPLAHHPRITATPHIGFVTEDDLDAQFADVYALVTAYAAGAPIHALNPGVRP